MRINTNIASMNAQQINSNTNKEIGSSLEKLASGHSINKASDDAAGLAIADKLRTQASSINQGIKNANSGVAMIQMADKAMEEQSNILNTIKTKLIQASDASTTADGRVAISADIDKLLESLDNIATQTDYNGTKLLQAASGTGATTALSFQTGELSTEVVTSGTIQANTTGLSLGTLDTAVSATGGISVSAAQTGQAAVDSALTELNKQRGDLGSTQLQLESSVRNNEVTKVSLQAAESVIRDTDYAAESANFNKLNIVSQAGMYAISQANTAQQNIQKLLQ
jgi:flagellin